MTVGKLEEPITGPVRPLEVNLKILALGKGICEALLI